MYHRSLSTEHHTNTLPPFILSDYTNHVSFRYGIYWFWIDTQSKSSKRVIDIVIYNNFEILQSNLSFQTEELPYQSYKSLDVLFVVQFSIFPFSYMIMRHWINFALHQVSCSTDLWCTENTNANKAHYETFWKPCFHALFLCL